MIHEKDFEDIICKYPELIEDGLILKGRQLILYSRRIDILFEDKFKRELIIELKAGPIKDEHIGQILSYEGMLLSAENPTLRVMLVGNRVPPNLQRSLDHHGIAWKEITQSRIEAFIKDKEDESFLNLFEFGKSNLNHNKLQKFNELPYQNNSMIQNPNFIRAEELVTKLKASEKYKSFKSILHIKNNNEAKAKTILKENSGRLTHEHIRQLINLIDEPYPYVYKGKINNRPWFGRLLKPNALNIFKEDYNKINSWFNVLCNNHFSVEKRFDLLQEEPYYIKGLKTGFITLMFYLLDKANYLIWFPSQHEGLKMIYPEIDKFTGSSAQYIIFINAAKKFAKQYDFEHTELDWLFYTKFDAI